MKEDVFNQYVDKVMYLFNIDRESLFSNSKKRHIVDARQMLYYLCHNRQMQFVTIKNFMLANGTSVLHNSIINGINNVKVKLEEDRDYQTIIRELEKSVFI
jgi:chromosomal replication initiation ATPase DnaA